MHPDQTLPYQEITFAAGETEKTVTVKSLSDDIDELGETFKVKLSDATPIVVIGDAEAVGTITDNDLRALSIADSSAPRRRWNDEVHDFAGKSRDAGCHGVLHHG
jgi:endoglucanase